MKRFYFILFLVLSVLMLAACAGLGEPTEVTSFTEPAQAGSKIVSTVDEFLAAIRPGAEIILGEGEFRLDTASDYGQRKGPYYIWNDLGLGQYELQIQYVDGLTIRGAGKDKTSLIVEPRFANVISIVDSENVTLQDMTLGHTEMPEPCDGGVIRLNNVEDILLRGLGLYGCGTLGVMAYECENLNMEQCDIYECSAGAIHLSKSEDVDIRDSSIHSIGKDLPAQQLIAMWGCEDVTVYNCDISNNYVQNLIYAEGIEKPVMIRNNRFTDNRVSESAFLFYSDGIVLDENTFEGTTPRTWYKPNTFAGIDSAGKAVVFVDTIPASTPAAPVETMPVSSGEQKTVKVKNANDFLKAIGPDTCIILNSKVLDLTQSESYQNSLAYFQKYPEPTTVYQEKGQPYYYWRNNYDGPSLVITGVSNLTIQGRDGKRTTHTLTAEPRYADVMTFENCSCVTLTGFTAGHSIKPGQCTGGVFLLENCEDILIDNCGMYGCGTEGVCGIGSRNIQIVNSEIFECSYYGIELIQCDNVSISGTIIRDIGDSWFEGSFFRFYDSQNVTLDGQVLDGNYTGN